jgi:hypothetical protein
MPPWPEEARYNDFPVEGVLALVAKVWFTATRGWPDGSKTEV